MNTITEKTAKYSLKSNAKILRKVKKKIFQRKKCEIWIQKKTSNAEILEQRIPQDFLRN